MTETQFDIIHYPDKRLHQPAIPVDRFDAALQEIIDIMFATHYSQTNCAPLAASQLAIPNPPCVTVIDFSEHKDSPLCLVNPEIVASSGETHEPEGCRSLPGVFEAVRRAEKIDVRARDRHGKLVLFVADGFMAKCIQHELDHLQGKLFIDHLSRLKKQRLEHKYRKLQKAAAKG